MRRENPSIILTQNAVLCFGDSTGRLNVMSADSSNAYTYLWSNGSDSSIVENVSTDWYTVSATDSFNCQTVDSVFVSEPTQLNLTQILQSDVLCNNGSDGFANYSFSGGVGGYSYSWSDSTGTWSGSSMCPVIVELTDSYGDGWNGGQVVVKWW